MTGRKKNGKKQHAEQHRKFSFRARQAKRLY
jgi:hypothetical protein